MNKRVNTLELLHALGFIYANHGQTKRALVLQLLASRIEPENRGVLRTLAHTFLSDGAPQHALAIIARLRLLKEDDPSLDLLHSRALWEAGERVEARRMFRRFMARRKHGEPARHEEEDRQAEHA